MAVLEGLPLDGWRLARRLGIARPAFTLEAIGGDNRSLGFADIQLSDRAAVARFWRAYPGASKYLLHAMDHKERSCVSCVVHPPKDVTP